MTEPVVRLRLYVAGRTVRSQRAIEQVERMAARLRGVDVEVIDVVAQPAVAEADRVLATPALVRQEPPPLRRIIGDLGDVERVAELLDLPLVGGIAQGVG